MKVEYRWCYLLPMDLLRVLSLSSKLATIWSMNISCICNHLGRRYMATDQEPPSLSFSFAVFGITALHNDRILHGIWTQLLLKVICERHKRKYLKSLETSGFTHRKLRQSHWRCMFIYVLKKEKVIHWFLKLICCLSQYF